MTGRGMWGSALALLAAGAFGCGGQTDGAGAKARPSASGTTTAAATASSQTVVAVARFDGSDGSGQAPDVEDFDGTTSYSNDPNVWITACHWAFGDGATSEDCWVEHTYTTAGSFRPTLTVTGSDGSTSSASLTVDVTGASTGTTSARPGDTRWQTVEGVGWPVQMVDDHHGNFLMVRRDNSHYAPWNLLESHDAQTGALNWSSQLPGGEDNYIGSLASAPDGTSVVTDEFVIDSSASLYKFSPTGQQEWWISIPVQHGLAVDTHGNIVVDANKGAYGTTALDKYDGSGQLVWERALPPSDANNGLRFDRLATDGQDNILVAGTVLGTVIWQGNTFGPAAQKTPVMMKLSANGDLLWAHTLSGLSGSFLSIGTSAAGTVVALLSSASGSSTWNAQAISAGLDVLTVEADGTLRWSRQLQATQPSRGELAVDPAGEVVVTFAGSCDSQLIEMNLANDVLWSRTFGSCGNSVGMPAVAVNAADQEVGFAADFNGTVDFGKGPVTSSDYETILVGIANGAPDSGGTLGGTSSGAVHAVIQFDGSSGQGVAPDVEDLDGTGSYSTDPNVWISACHWNFGDGATSSDCWVEHTYSGAGTYHPTLTVTGSDGSTSSASVEVDVTAN